MSNKSRIPALSEASFDGALLWFAEMQYADLLFHPEDAPETIVTINTGERVFSKTECKTLSNILDTLEATIGHDQVLDAAYPVFMNAMGIRLDS